METHRLGGRILPALIRSAPCRSLLADSDVECGVEWTSQKAAAHQRSRQYYRPHETMFKQNRIGRRHFLGSITYFVAAAFAPYAFAQNRPHAGDQQSNPQPNEANKEHNAMNYPTAPFPYQRQDPPGLAGKMIPRP